MREHTKAKYRVVVLGLIALLGPTAFNIAPGPFATVFSLLLIGYSLWTLRLTAVFRDDEQLGFLLCGIDVAIIVPLFVWGSPTWLAVPLVLFWVAGCVVTLRARSVVRREVRRESESSVDGLTGLLSRGLLDSVVTRRTALHDYDEATFGLVTLRVHRFNELACYYGRESADQSLVAVSRRALRVVGERAEGFRTGIDTVAFLLPFSRPLELAEVAMEVAGAANGRLVNGKRIDCLIGYACAPRDGATAHELLERADLRAFGARLSQPTVDTPTRSGTARARAAAG
jgi:GGDEF domain-containing protein